MEQPAQDTAPVKLPEPEILPERSDAAAAGKPGIPVLTYVTGRIG